MSHNLQVSGLISSANRISFLLLFPVVKLQKKMLMIPFQKQTILYLVALVGVLVINAHQ